MKEPIKSSVNMDTIIKDVKNGIKDKDRERYLEYANIKDDFSIYKCSCCNKNYQKKFDEDLKKRFISTYKFSNYDINKFIFLL